MKIDEALYQLKQNIKMHKIEGTTSNQNEREKALLDYITNLQEQLHQASLDIQELTEKDIGCPSWCDKLTNLQEENEHLQKQNKGLNNLIFQHIDEEDNLIDYKSRNEKAIRYIEERKNLNWYADGVFVYELLNILNGSDEE